MPDPPGPCTWVARRRMSTRWRRRPSTKLSHPRPRCPWTPSSAHCLCFCNPGAWLPNLSILCFRWSSSTAGVTQSTGQLPGTGCLSILAPCAHHTLDHATCLLLQTHRTLGAEFSLLFWLWTPKFVSKWRPSGPSSSDHHGDWPVL